MKPTLSDNKQFIIQAFKPHLGLLGIWFIFLIVGGFFTYLGTKIDDNGIAFIIFGCVFMILASAFMLFTLPSSFMYYYEQAKIKKYGSYTSARIINKRIDNYTHKTSSFNSRQPKHINEFLYVIEFEFIYNNQVYKNECFFEHQSTFETISLDTELPIKFLKTNPKNTTLRRRKLSNQLGITEKMCR
ncbi:hypothetical protein [Olleya sp. YS]|uniref:hypothetical protein n=1 Tax=Olleya sp. YS TaxID=3028318 RepID=UPI0024340CBF|nr:hypothetical protein [Olleya sp. YS]WGD34002.1 hypothetical protein Ollyesu_09440 [Olleya sp. YS]